LFNRSLFAPHKVTSEVIMVTLWQNGGGSVSGKSPLRLAGRWPTMWRPRHFPPGSVLPALVKSGLAA
jgi:hypothetical protein